jgi:hypothetical protein
VSRRSRSLLERPSASPKPIVSGSETNHVVWGANGWNLLLANQPCSSDPLVMSMTDELTYRNKPAGSWSTAGAATRASQFHSDRCRQCLPPTLRPSWYEAVGRRAGVSLCAYRLLCSHFRRSGRRGPTSFATQIHLRPSRASLRGAIELTSLSAILSSCAPSARRSTQLHSSRVRIRGSSRDGHQPLLFGSEIPRDSYACTLGAEADLLVSLEAIQRWVEA